MKKTILILLILMCAIGSQAQLSTNQYKQTSTMIATVVKPLIADIAALKLQVKALQDSLAAFKNGMVKSNTLSFIYPAYGKATEMPNSYVIGFDTLYFKK